MAIFRYKISALLIVALLSFNVTLFAQQEQKVASAVTQVKVYVNNAQITREANTQINKGVTALVFGKISPFINPNSIQVNAKEEFLILSVALRQNNQTITLPPDLQLLQDSVEKLKHALLLIDITKEALKLEKEVLLANKKLGSDNGSIKVEDLEDALHLTRKRSQEIGEELLKNSIQEIQINQQMQLMLQKIETYKQNESGSFEIVVTVKANEDLDEANLAITYLTDQAGWTPFYDVRIKDISSQMQLISKANITQNTGEIWKNVKLTLSTGNPSYGGIKPNLAITRIGFVEQHYIQSVADMQVAGAVMESDKPSKARNKSMITNEASINQTATNTEFVVANPYTILSNGIAQQVDLNSYLIKATYQHATVPKISPEVFVTAKCLTSEFLGLLSGEMNVFFAGAFVGKSYLNVNATDTTEITLGKDNRLFTERILLKEFSSKSTFGSQVKTNYAYEIKVKNTKKEPVYILVEDQVPVSNNKEIEVSITELGNATYDAETGKLTWLVKLDAEKLTSLKFGFEVKHPKDKNVTPF